MGALASCKVSCCAAACFGTVATAALPRTLETSPLMPAASCLSVLVGVLHALPPRVRVCQSGASPRRQLQYRYW